MREKWWLTLKDPKLNALIKLALDGNMNLQGTWDRLDQALALARMRDAGASIVSREMVAFEWLRKADSDLFREISRNFLR